MSHYLCEELICEIFERLPSKSLIRFRSLSKSWCSRISSSSFIRKHAIRSVQTSLKFIVRQRMYYMKDIRIVSYRLHPKDPYESIHSIKFPLKKANIAGSCNGIICLYKQIRTPSITLWNPSIRRKLTVPNHPFRLFCVAVGFGFDPITDDYKIVVITYVNVQNSFLYSMKTNFWNEIAPPKTPFFQMKSLACFINGALHWVAKCKSDNVDHCYILTFDLSTHVFGQISLPKPGWITKQLTVIKGSLAVISSDNDGYDSWIWVREEHTNVASWSKAYDLTSVGFKGVYSFVFSDNFVGDFEAYNHENGIRSTLRVSSDSSYRVDMDMCVESLELLDKEIC